jgi:hypothetical protein
MKSLASLIAVVLFSVTKSLAVGPVAAMPLNGPWKFHTGDDKRWADPNFNDSAWETIDLTPPPGAHDGDVGLSGYVLGWTARGHAGYSGYAWYRLRIAPDPLNNQLLALTGPPLVDDAYQVYANGILLGSDGDFSETTPVVYAIQPRLFTLPASSQTVIAFRVWVDAGTVSASPADAGGIHIAPAIGTKTAIQSLYHHEWMQTFYGYVVDGVEPVFFTVLAVFAYCIYMFANKNPAYLWLILALMLTALVRVNQLVFFWMQVESAHEYDLVREVILTPLGIAIWIIAWRAWLGISNSILWLPKITAIITSLFILCRLFSLPWFMPGVFHSYNNNFDTACNILRLVLLVILLVVIFTGIRQNKNVRWLTLLAMILIAAGLFAQELSAIHVPGIWFPFGVGVSRTQYAYAGFIILMFMLLLFTRKEISLNQKTSTENP